MRKILFLFFVLLFVYLLSLNLFANVFEFVSWLLFIDSNKATLSLIGECILRLLTFGISFKLVDWIHGFINLYDRRVMKLSYWMCSILLGFALSYIIWIFEEYIDIITIIFIPITSIILIGMSVKTLLFKGVTYNENNAR